MPCSRRVPCQKKLIAAVSCLIASACLAQSTVGALAQQGAKKPSEAEMRRLHGGGVALQGITRLGAPFKQQHRPDGSVSGSIRHAQGEDGIFGHWHIDDAGKQCIAVKYTNGGELDACFYVWMLAGRYFSASADVPDAPVRTIEYVK